MEKEVMGIYVSDHPLRGHERVIAQSATHTCSSIQEQDENAFVKIAGVLSKMRTIVTKAEGKRMATISIEDFSGVANLIAFPATYEKVKDLLQKDTVVQATGYVMHREMRGEKSIEIRMEDIKPIEPSLFPDFSQGAGSAGIVTISIWRATEGQMFNLRQVIEDHPGEYEVLIQIVNGHGTTPIYLPHQVNPTDVFQKTVTQGLSRCELEVQHNEAA
jgi:DNA polymerase-3 subunit alpha